MGQGRRRTGKFRLKLSEGKHEQAFLELPTFPSSRWRTSRSLRLHDLIGKYEGPDINLDFDEEGVLVRIEVLV